MKKLPNLRTVLFFQAFTAILMPAYFLIIIWVPEFLSFHMMLVVWGVLVIGLVVQTRLEKRVKADTDECALQTLRAAEASCMESAVTVLTVLVILVAANQASGSEQAFARIMEYLPLLLTAAIFLIYLERAVLFAYWDKKGLPPC